jgi:hypothetical protein
MISPMGMPDSKCYQQNIPMILTEMPQIPGGFLIMPPASSISAD